MLSGDTNKRTRALTPWKFLMSASVFTRLHWPADHWYSPPSPSPTTGQRNSGCFSVFSIGLESSFSSRAGTGKTGGKWGGIWGESRGEKRKENGRKMGKNEGRGGKWGKREEGAGNTEENGEKGREKVAINDHTWKIQLFS